jgi:hypothetical protein
MSKQAFVPVVAVAAALVLTLNAVQHARATQLPASNAVYGHGNGSCGQWVQDKVNASDRDADLAWVLGFLSGAGAVASSLKDDLGTKLNVRELRRTDAPAVTLWMDQYCAAHPLSRIVDASYKLMDELLTPAKAKQ